MERPYRVDIVDKDGNLILRFDGPVIKKFQSSGRLGGRVDETLVVGDGTCFVIGKRFNSMKAKTC